MEPLIDAIGTTEARLEPVGLAARDRLRKDLVDARAVFGVDGVVTGPMPQLLKRLTEVLDELGADQFQLAGRRHHEKDDAGNTAHDRCGSASRVRLALRGIRRQLHKREGRLVGGNAQQHAVGLGREVRPLRAGHQHPDVATQPQSRRRNGKAGVAEADLRTRRPCRRVMSQRPAERHADLARLQRSERRRQASHLDRRHALRRGQAQIDDIHVQRREQRIEQRVGNMRRVVARPLRRKREDAGELVHAALQAPDLVTRMFDVRLHLQIPVRRLRFATKPARQHAERVLSNGSRRARSLKNNAHSIDKGR